MGGKTKRLCVFLVCGVVSQCCFVRSAEAQGAVARENGYMELDTTWFVKENAREKFKDDTCLEEFVVVGYGRARKQDVAGATASMDVSWSSLGEADALTEALKGKVAGVRVRSSEGGVLGIDEVLIRGGASITGNASPLYVVDGFPMTSIVDIPISDIESIDVLKDAASAAIYGARAAGGVVLITTKKASSEGLHLSYSSDYSFGRMSGRLSTLSPLDFAKLNYEAAAMKGAESYESFVGAYGDYASLEKYANIEPRDYVDEIYGRLSFATSQAVGLTYRNERTNLKVAYQYDKNEGVMLGSDMRRHNFSLGLMQKLWTRRWDIISLDFKAAYTNRETNGAGSGGEGTTTTSRLKNSLLYSPIPPKGDSEEAYEQSAQVYDPVEVTNDDYRRETKNSVRADGGLRIQPREWMEVSTYFGLMASFATIDQCYGPATPQARAYNSQPIAIKRDATDSQTRVTNTISARPLFNFKRHDLQVLLGHEYVRGNGSSVQSESLYFPKYLSAEQCLANMSLGAPSPTNTTVNPTNALLSFFGRTSYTFDDRYILTATVRGDKSSKFAEGRQWGAFPSVSAAWRISEEGFMRGLNAVSEAKLRMSYGLAGNNNVAFCMYENTYRAQSVSDPNLTIGGLQQSYISGAQYMANPDLTWEWTISRNVGLDLSFFRGRLGIESDFYINTTDNLLLQVDLPLASGYDYVMRNVGAVSAKGMEFTLRGKIVDMKRWGIGLEANISLMKSRVENLGGLEEMEMTSGWAGSEISGDYILRVGEPVGSIYGYATEGKYEVSDFDYKDGEYVLKSGVASDAALLGMSGARPGMLKLRDQNGDGVIDEMDKVIIGCAQPKHTGGLTLKGHCYGVDVSVGLDWSYGNDVLNATKIESTTSNKYSMRNMTSEMENRWTYVDKEGNVVDDSAELAALNSGAEIWSPLMNRYVTHSWAVEDGSFLRLSNITVGYTFPERLREKLRLTKLRLYGYAGNLKCWTRYSGQDPEVSVRRKTAATPGVDYSATPRRRVFGFGMEIGF